MARYSISVYERARSPIGSRFTLKGKAEYSFSELKTSWEMGRGKWLSLGNGSYAKDKDLRDLMRRIGSETDEVFV